MKALPTNRISLIAALAATASLTVGGTAVAQQPTIAPRVIAGDPASPYAAGSVAIETPDSYCTAGLWKPRILITAAHCVKEEGKGGAGVPAAAFTVFPPGANKAAGPSPVTVIEVIYDPAWDGTENDLAFLVLSAPLGAPIVSRMATQAEVVSLSKARATAHYVGYGLTGPSGDGSSEVSLVPFGVSESLTADGESGGVGTFETDGDGIHGTCQGDSGGPYVATLGSELVYLGPLSGGDGPPCDDPSAYAFETGAIASTHVDLINRALAAAGEVATAPAALPLKTCIKIPGTARTCLAGTSWVYDECWSASRALLDKLVDGSWQRVATLRAKRNRDCGKKYPYNVVFRGDDAAGTVKYRVVMPKQAGLRGGATDPFTVTHPAG